MSRVGPTLTRIASSYGCLLGRGGARCAGTTSLKDANYSDCTITLMWAALTAAGAIVAALG